MARTYNGNFLTADGTLIVRGGEFVFTDASPASPGPLNATSPVGTVTSGALPTVTLTTATGAQVSTTRDVNLYIELASDATNNAASCAVALSPDNSTYTTVETPSVAAAINNLGAVVMGVNIRVPAGWYVKLTTTRMTIGAAGVCSYA